MQASCESKQKKKYFVQSKRTTHTQTSTKKHKTKKVNIKHTIHKTQYFTIFHIHNKWIKSIKRKECKMAQLTQPKRFKTSLTQLCVAHITNFKPFKSKTKTKTTNNQSPETSQPKNSTNISFLQQVHTWAADIILLLLSTGRTVYFTQRWQNSWRGLTWVCIIRASLNI